ncbi:MAG: hypothetical protein NC416_08690 [Eubacterium sp.]|nr:hypothetical protein [Eubacterium sp.]
MLYDGLDLQTAKVGKSTCRNEVIAEAFHYMHIIESWGTGIPRIINRCREFGLAEPLFEEFGNGFKVTMFRKTSSTFEKVSNASEKVSNAPEKVSNDPKKVSNAPEKVSNAPKKVSNAPEKVSNAPEKVSNAPKKVNNAFEKYMPFLLEAKITEKYIKSIENIFAECNTCTPFGQTKVMECLHCSKSKATNVMKAMKKAKIIRKIVGLGPGRYEFIEL